MDNQKLYDLKNAFLEEWPIERLETMSIEEYTNLDKTSFCYWVEQKTESLGGIRGGSSYKFGIYRMAETSKTEPAQNRTNNGEYAWHTKYGSTQKEAFGSIKEMIIKIAKLCQGKELNVIDNIDLGDSYKWKIAFLYSDFNVINIFNKFSLNRVLMGLKLENNDSQTISEINKLIVKQKPENEDFFSYSAMLWEAYGKQHDTAKLFKKWLIEKQNIKSGKVTSYIRAINILINHFNIAVYDENDIDELHFLYEDLKEKQKDVNGKYYYKKSPSYGESGFYSAAIKSYIDYLNDQTNSTSTTMENTEASSVNLQVLNKILFGPPGTGKTYNTINESLLIVDQEFYNDNKDNRAALNKRFKDLLIKNWDKTDGQIAFCTFHQSFSYEDFVEGIKPKVNDNKEVYYEIEDGVFKNICQLASSSISAVKMKKEGKLSWDEETFNQASFYKLSLGDSTKSEDKTIYDYCVENNVIALGYGDNNDFSSLSEGQITEKCEDLKFDSNVAQSLNYFIHYIKKNNYVIIGNGNKFVRAIAKVVGDYEYDSTTPIAYNHFRKVEWIFKDENIPIEELYNRGLSQQTIYKIDEHGLKKDFFVNHGQLLEPESKKVKDYVLIIDEINRGNVSSIFGELITLIEKDKRAGGKEELEVTLPYSKEPFKVPHNVYIVGTMNTADRSIEALDTALRRRFAFDEIPPKPELILTEGSSGKVNGIVDGINLKDLLDKINIRIEKLIDKDHKIGHSYFLKVNDLPTLKACFKNEVIPLLEEYFFGDYGKIGLVLGDSFITKDDTEAFEFAKFEGYDTDVSSDLKERSVYKIRPSKEWDFNAI
ncbi:5-methylcytosine-specific restriction protein B [Flavobacteriaceae bacterium MAR_2010_72]|nr:5-methylcytosine-specific restriction protein B [Flavobacteriaceae bacterium MAR_2010_72]